MSLIPAAAGRGGAGVSLTAEGRRLARVETVALRRGDALLEIQTIGRFALDDRRVAKLTAWLGGRVESVAIPYVGFWVAKGDPILDLWVPDLPALVAELKGAKSLGDEVRRALVDRLTRAGITEKQIAELESQESPKPTITLFSPISGVVVERPAQPGLVVKEGDLLAQLAALDPLILEAEVFERDLAFVGPGALVEIAVDAIPNQTFLGSVESMKPMLDPASRTVGARILMRNPGGLARPGMFARATIRAELGADGLPLAARTQEYARETPIPTIETGSGPTSRPGSPPASEPAPDAPVKRKKPLILPAGALLDLGARKIVYVETSPGRYEPREVSVGPRVRDGFVVTGGLAEGELVVARGAFLVDSQTQIEGKPSLLYPAGADAAGEHQHSAPKPGDKR
jgi:Cu(I)/Ag(I) efflux system membrane fusion protein